MKATATRAPVPKKKGLNLPDKEPGLKVIKEIDESVCIRSNALTARSVIGDGRSAINTFNTDSVILGKPAPEIKKAIPQSKTPLIDPVKSGIKGKPYTIDQHKFNTLSQAYTASLPHFQSMVNAYTTLGLSLIHI